MAGIRRRVRETEVDVRAALAVRIARIARDFTEANNGRTYVHPGHRWLAGLGDGEPVDVWPQLLRDIVPVDPTWRLVRVHPDGGVSEASYERHQE